jgi:hypothetical protein
VIKRATGFPSRYPWTMDPPRSTGSFKPMDESAVRILPPRRLRASRMATLKGASWRAAASPLMPQPMMIASYFAMLHASLAPLSVERVRLRSERERGEVGQGGFHLALTCTATGQRLGRKEQAILGIRKVSPSTRYSP